VVDCTWSVTWESIEGDDWSEYLHDGEMKDKSVPSIIAYARKMGGSGSKAGLEAHTENHRNF
jgi:hypothetical protein